MKTMILLIRHGVTPFNKQKRMQGHIDTELHEDGVDQAMKLKEKMKNVKIDVVYSSPLKRALSTAKAAFPDRNIIIEDDLKERCYGILEGLTLKEVENSVGKDVYEEYLKSRHLEVEGCESQEDLENRVCSIMEKIARSNHGKTVAVVAHGGLFNAFYLKISNRPREDYRVFRSHNASVTEVIYDNGKWELKNFNDISHMQIHASAPGKMMIAGEWAVLEVGNPCIVAAVDKRVHVVASPAHHPGDSITVDVDDFGIKGVGAEYADGKISWKNADEKQAEKLIFLKGSVETVLQYIGKWKPFHLRGWGEDTSVIVDGIQKKIGFGSSAASVVAAIGAMLAFHGYDIEKNRNLIYKLSAIAHYQAQGKVGSAFDVAASTYGGISVYRRFDSKWLVSELQKRSIREVADSEWPHFYTEQMPIPSDMNLLVGWTKESASTVNLVKEMNSFKESSPAEYKKIYDEIAATVNKLIDAWKKNNMNEILEELRHNRKLLAELTEKSKLPIEIHALKDLADAAESDRSAGKLSGAGGGDCGIAVCFDAITAQAIREKWKKKGLYPLDVSVDRKGIMLQ